MNALIYRVMSYNELLERLNETGTLQLKDIHNESNIQNNIDIRKELKKQEDQYNREVNEDMEKNREQWEEIVRQAENQRDISNGITSESLIDPATTSGDPDI